MLADVLGSKVGELPTVYLDMPFGVKATQRGYGVV